MIVSTCNRVEIITATDSPSVDLSALLRLTSDSIQQSLTSHLYQHRDQQAVRHLFRVAASLDSMVVGESQILGQVKEAFAVARTAGTVGGELDHLLQSAFSAAKKFAPKPKSAPTRVSIASVAVELAQQNLRIAAGPDCVSGRRRQNERTCGPPPGAAGRRNDPRDQPHPWSARSAWPSPSTAASSPLNKLYDYAAEADIIITSTGAPHHIFRREHGQAFLHKRRNRPMFFIDIAVPRDVDPAMNKLEGLFVYDIDDLQQVAACPHGRAQARLPRAPKS